MGKEFIYYSGISIKEGLDISSKNLWTYSKEKSQKCSLRSQLFIISKNFNNNDHKICNECHKIVSTTEIDEKMCVFWKNNTKYRVYSNLDMNKYDCRFDAREELNQVLLSIGCKYKVSR